MNPNTPYGQPMPMHGQQSQRRHEMQYNQMPPHSMRTQHPVYPQYYQQSMAPMMPPYPQPYPQHYYQYQQSLYIPHHNGRPQYYPQAPPPPHSVPHVSPHHGHFVPAQHYQQQSPRHVSSSIQSYPPPLPSRTASTTSVPQLPTPPSRPISTTSAVNVKKEASPPATPVALVAQTAETPSSKPPAPREPFVPPLPWLSVQDQPFPSRAPRVRRTVTRSSLGTEAVTFPLAEEVPEQSLATASTEPVKQELQEEEISVPTPTQTPTPLASDAPSDSVSTQPTTPSSVTPVSLSKVQITPTQTKSTRAAIPVVPVVPVLPHSPIANRAHRDSVTSKPDESTETVEPQLQSGEAASEAQDAEKPVITSPPPPPTSWAALLRSKDAAASPSIGTTSSAVANGFGVPKNETLGTVLSEINANETPSKVAFLQPRGLVNTGNMCYMNSILQMLVFCTPFYEFLDRVAKRAPHTFKSDTPLIDAMILFTREYPTIDSAASIDQLRLRLKAEDYERYGESFIPEYVYNVIKQLPRFRDMRRGHQQDAQEFLGFLLEELHEECAQAMRSGANTNSDGAAPAGSTADVPEAHNDDSGWMEVGAKQKSAITRSSGTVVTESPVTSIFGGKLRSELKVAGNKLSVTQEPYQPLQLDIGASNINNIIDALKGLTKPESMQGDFQSARGTKNTATKQVFIETLPPVLILHLKRFHYDASTNRVEKIWKKVGYPLELELPKEVFPTAARNKYVAHGGYPKYRLIGVIYHHGKNANGGHYTVDIRRQDGREWIRLDDTIIRRIRSDDVAEGGSEEDPKILAAALEQHSQGKTTNNRFEQIEDSQAENDSDKVWNQVNGHSRSKSTMSAIVNGTSTPAMDSSGPQTPRDRFSVKDNKVAYLLFYQRVTA